eukprot:CAMPEP_0182421478 /NCGR_PEP_ID=MMETSP1167-20130531/6896_1 /TAXON_ID=2988 /ORGANISM="Mallomonas Sp, Strain CCMP3275" /LENGTH=837 /DNA_ID=CAMNT_0024598675 /DNA_START=264 /DNA_END=2777 /DNA_ORIENTATION=+
MNINLQSKLKALAIADKVISHALDEGRIGISPNISLPGFDSIMTIVSELALTRSIAFYPILSSNNYKEWEEYASKNFDLLNGPSTIKGIVDQGIYRRDSKGEKVYDAKSADGVMFPDIVTPVWQVAPVSVTGAIKSVMYNVHSLKSRADVIDKVINTRTAGFTDIIQPVGSTVLSPSTLVYAPVIRLKDGEILGIVSAFLRWEDILKGALPSYISNYDCVLSDASRSFTFKVSGGEIEVRAGDTHDIRFNDHRRVVTASLTSLTSISASDYTMTLYPTQELYNNYMTDTPMIACISTVAVILFTALVVMLYDYYLVQRDKRLERAIESTTKITSLTLRELENRKTFMMHISQGVSKPLSTIKIVLDTLKHEVSTGCNTKVLDLSIDKINESCNAASEVINDFVLFDKIIANNMTLELTRYNILHFIFEATLPLQIQARKCGITLEVVNEASDSDTLKNFQVNIDKSKLAYVVSNLLSNAMKFTPRNGKVTVRIKKNKSGKLANEGSDCGRVIIDIIDTGIGISQENQKNFFESITHFKEFELPSEGVALSMYISYSIIRLHEGNLSVQSAGESYGTTFSLELPLAPKIKPTNIMDVFSDRKGQFHTPLVSDHQTHLCDVMAKGCLAEKTVSFDNDNQKESEEVVVIDKKSSVKQVDMDDNMNDFIIHHDCVRNYMDEESSCIEKGINENQKIIHTLVLDESTSYRKKVCRMLNNSVHTSFKYQCEEMDWKDGLEKFQRAQEINNINSQSLFDKALAASQLYDLILINYSNSSLSGPKVSKKLRDMGYVGHIIGMMDDKNAEEELLFMEHGADKVMVKPLDINKIGRFLNYHEMDCLF